MKKKQSETRISFHIFLALCISVLIASCSKDSEYRTVDFSNTVKVAQPEGRESDEKTLRVAVAAMISPKETLYYYQEVLNYIGDRLGYKIKLIQKKTYGEINELFPKQQIDLAFVCSGPYAVSKDIFGFEALATPIVRERPYYQSYLIVHKSSGFKRFEDLRGHVFAYTDPESNTGALVPNYWLAQTGETAASFFRRTTYTYSHDNSIMAVAKRLVDGATVDGHKWEFFNADQSRFTSQTRVIKKSEWFGSPPLVAAFFLMEDLKSDIRRIVITMHQDPEGINILNKLMIDRFEPPKDVWYEPVRVMYNHVHKTD